MADSQSNKRLISESYLKIQKELHKSEGYGLSGWKWADIVKSFGYTDILDYGCGKKTLEKKLGFPIKNYDPAIPGCEKAEPADFVYCGDVLEHIEPECIEDVLSHISSLCKEKALLVIATSPAKRILPDGRNAHILLKSPDWWREILNRHFDVGDFTVAEKAISVVATPK